MSPPALPSTTPRPSDAGAPPCCGGPPVLDASACCARTKRRRPRQGRLRLRRGGRARSSYRGCRGERLGRMLRCQGGAAGRCVTSLATLRHTRYPEQRNGADMSPRRLAAPSGDLEAAYAQTRRSLLSYLRRLSGDAQVAEDLMHDVMVKALTALGEEREAPRNLGAWLYRVAHNAAMDHHRASRADQPWDDDAADSIGRRYARCRTTGRARCVGGRLAVPASDRGTAARDLSRSGSRLGVRASAAA